MINFYDTVVSYNRQAMIALRNEQMAAAFSLLTQAERILRRKNLQGVDGLMPITLNNLGVFYKKTGDYCEAIKVLNKSILENRSDNITKANTYLNLSTVYSSLIDYEKASSCSSQAVKVLKSLKSRPEDYKRTLLSAYSSLATVEEHLSQYQLSQKYYKKALKIAKNSFPSHDYYNKIQDRYLILQGKLATVLLASDSFSAKTQKNKKRNLFTPNPAVRKTSVESGKKYRENSFDVLLETRRSPDSPNKCNQSDIVSGKFLLFSKGSSEDYYKKGKKSRNLNVGARKKGKKVKRGKRIVSKTPEIAPVPFKSKLLLFNTLAN